MLRKNICTKIGTNKTTARSVPICCSAFFFFFFFFRYFLVFSLFFSNFFLFFFFRTSLTTFSFTLPPLLKNQNETKPNPRNRNKRMFSESELFDECEKKTAKFIKTREGTFAEIWDAICRYIDNQLENGKV